MTTAQIDARYGHDSTGSAAVAITPITSTTTATGKTGSTLVYEGHTAVADTVDSLAFTNFSVSKSSGGPEFRYLANYQLVLRGSPPPPAGVLPVGGLPSSRLYMRFDLPSVLIDSSTTIVVESPVPTGHMTAPNSGSSPVTSSTLSSRL